MDSNELDTSQTLNFKSLVPVSNNHYLEWKAIPTNKFRGKERVWIPQSFPSKDYKDFKKEFIPYIKNIVEQFNWDIEPTKSKHYFLDIIMYFDRIDKDPNNYFKTICDCCNEIVYVDDRTIVTRVNRVYYTYNEQVPPHFEYCLYPVDYIGIFNSEHEYITFLENCKQCSKYKDGDCKHLNDFLSYKITENFNWNERYCTMFKLIKPKK